MNIKRLCWVIRFLFASLFNHASLAGNISLKTCDVVHKKIMANCHDTITNSWAECWKKIMNTQLNARLVKLKISDAEQFHTEITIQKSFNAATENLCGKICNGGNGTMKGISYNYCRVHAYKHRTVQAIQINKNTLTIPVIINFSLEKPRTGKIKIRILIKILLVIFSKCLKLFVKMASYQKIVKTKRLTNSINCLILMMCVIYRRLSPTTKNNLDLAL